MPIQEIYVASKKHDDLFQGIRSKNKLAQGIIMDNIAKDVLGVERVGAQRSGDTELTGLCDERTFLRAFFAAQVTRKRKSEGRIPPQLDATFIFSRWVQNRIGEHVGIIEHAKYLDVPFVLPRPNGKIIGTGHDASPVLDYRIISSDKQPDVVSGEISFGVWWTPEDPDKRRKEDITDEDIDDFTVLKIQRQWSGTEVEIVDNVATETDLDIIIGEHNIQRAEMQYYTAKKQARDSDQESLYQMASSFNILLS